MNLFFIKTSNNDTTAPINNEAIKGNILSGAYKIVSKRGRSKVWEVYGRIEDSEGVEITNKVCCKTCFSVLKYDSRSTSNLVKHKCYANMKENSLVKVEVNNDIKKEALRLICQWSVENCRPFQIVHDSGLKQFAEFMVSVGAKYGANVDVEKLLPHATTISRNISNLFETTFAKVKYEISLNCNHGYGLTSDLWTDNYIRQSYICLTIHYIKNGQLVSRLLGLLSMDGERSTSMSIVRYVLQTINVLIFLDIIVRIKIQRLLEDYNCKLEDAIMVTDRGSNMVAAFNQFNHIYCINHLLNNVVDKSIKQVDDVAELCNLCSKVVKYFKKSGSNCSLDTSLKSFCPTRWNTMYYLLDSVEKNWLEIGNILQQKKELHKIENINISYIKGVVSVLKPFEEASKKLEGEKYATLHLVYPYINGLKNTCVVGNEDIDIIKRFKEALSDQIQSVVMPNLTITHKIALFLFPPANKLLHFNEDEKVLVKSECARQLQSYCHNVDEEEEENGLSSFPQTSSIISSYFANVVTSTIDINPDCKIEEEIHAYENLSISFQEHFDVIQWWNSRKSQFPLLYKLSCKILGTPASSASSERVFSSARHLLSEKRTNISSNSNTFNQIMFLHSNAENKFVLDESNNNVA